MKKKVTPEYPKEVVKPVYGFLRTKLNTLLARRKHIENEDPFKDVSRVTDNAATDIEADEQFGHANTSALRKEVTRTIIQVKKALARIRVGKYGVCEKCGQMIDTDRLVIYPEATLCTTDARKKK